MLTYPICTDHPKAIRISPTGRTTTTTVLLQAGQAATATYRCSLSHHFLTSSRLHNKPDHANDQQQQHNMATAATQKPLTTHTPRSTTHVPPRNGGYSLQQLTLLFFFPPPPRSPYMQNNCNRTRKTIVAPQQSSDSVEYLVKKCRSMYAHLNTLTVMCVHHTTTAKARPLILRAAAFCPQDNTNTIIYSASHVHVKR